MANIVSQNTSPTLNLKNIEDLGSTLVDRNFGRPEDYINIHTTSSKLTIKHGISAFEDKLDDRFIRAHRSYIVNKQKVTAYTKQDIEIGEIEIPIGDLYKKSALDNLKI